MTKATKNQHRVKARGSRVRARQFILLDPFKRWRQQFRGAGSVFCSKPDEVGHAIRNATRHSLWISSGSHTTDKMLRAMSSALAGHHPRPLQLGDILMLRAPREQALSILHSRFRKVIGESGSFKTLPPGQLREVLLASEEERRDVFVGGDVDVTSGMLALVRGNLELTSLPLSVFRASGTSQPDFGRFELDDYGHTVRFGDYEAAADFILYEVDPDYRRRLRAWRRAEERGFGPSLRRLRIQRGLSRDEFPGISARTIARIEHGEVEKPHGSTLQVIASRLGVEAEQIEQY
jgi:hypothetical protein